MTNFLGVAATLAGVAAVLSVGSGVYELWQEYRSTRKASSDVGAKPDGSIGSDGARMPVEVRMQGQKSATIQMTIADYKRLIH